MPQQRNREIIRQWSILRAIESSSDRTINALAADFEVCTRTIRRDLHALESAGFPLYPEVGDSGEQYWRLSARPFRKLTDTAFTLSELCAFWANRTRLTATGGSPIDADLQSALTKVARALSPHMKAYLDKLAAVVTCKPGPCGRGDGRAHGLFVDALVRATVDHHRVEMEYHSFASRKVKTYTIEPHRVTFASGGLYLYAFVPAYAQMRTFALHRIRKLRTLDATFNPVQIAGDPYEASLGVYAGGKAERVELEFSPAVAPYIEEREWHKSQQLTRHTDGSVVLKLDVAVDFPLRSWILGFGHHARVLRPSYLAATILEEHAEALEQYAPPMPFDAEATPFDLRRTAFLPFPSVGPRSPRASRSASRASSRRRPASSYALAPSPSARR